MYLEWFSNKVGRVVIQSTRLQVERLGNRAFELTDEQWLEQQRDNEREIDHFIVQLGDAMDQQNDKNE